MSNPTIPVTTVGNNSFAEVPWPGMPDPKLPRSLHRVVTVAGTKYALGGLVDPAGLRLNSVQFIPEKANGSPNTGDIYIYIYDKDADDGSFILAYTITSSGPPVDWNPPDGYQYNGADFKIGAATSGDAVRIIYS